jgi:hypothetical protein
LRTYLIDFLEFLRQFLQVYNREWNCVPSDAIEKEFYTVAIYEDDKNTTEKTVYTVKSAISQIDHSLNEQTGMKVIDAQLKTLYGSDGYYSFVSNVSYDTASRILEVLVNQGYRVRMVSNTFRRKQAIIIKLLKFFQSLSSTCDEISSVICEPFTILFLIDLFKENISLDKELTKTFNHFILALMPHPDFKMKAAVAYAEVYESITEKYEQNFGLSAGPINLFTLSVQFLNREQFIDELVNHYSFFQKVLLSLLRMLQYGHEQAFPPSFEKSVMDRFVYAKKRYYPLFGDLKVKDVSVSIYDFILSFFLTKLYSLFL